MTGISRSVSGSFSILPTRCLYLLVIRIYSYSGIAQQSLRTGGCDLYEAIFADDRILDMPEMSGLLFMLYLGIRNGGLADRTPVDDSGTLVDVALVVQT